MFVRLASMADLDAMTWVLVGASPMDPVYPYRFPDRHLYPDRFADLCRQKCIEYLTTSTVVVCEISAYGQSRVVAFSAWDKPQSLQEKALLPIAEPTPTQPSISPLTIGHRDRMQAFRHACTLNKHQMFDTRYPHNGHMFLKILVCHPDFQRRGAGRALTMWGIEEARRLRVHTTVFASPMGLRLYQKLGFREVGRFRVQLSGEGEFLEIPALVLRTGSTGMAGGEGGYDGLYEGSSYEGGVKGGYGMEKRVLQEVY